MSLVHLWWEPEHALCGSTEVGHREPCIRNMRWPNISWDDVRCECGVAVCRACMRIAAERHGFPIANVALLREPLPPHVVSV